MHSGRKGAGGQIAEASARSAAQEGAVAGAVVSVHPEGLWRHGLGPARQCAGADGTWGKLARRAVDEHARSRRRLDADHSRAWHRVSEGKILKTPAQRRKAHL